MAKVVTESFRVESTNDFVDSFSDAAKNDYYIMASSNSAGNSISNSQSDIRDFERKVIFGNKITSDDVRYMFPINPWSSGTVYDAFDDTQDMSTKNFYVTVLDGTINEASYKVLKCVRNNNGSPSTTNPSTANLDSLFETTQTDGYVWKLLFTVPPAQYILFGTSQLLPYIQDDNIVDNSKQGISDILIETSPAGAYSGYVIGNDNPSSGVIAAAPQLLSANPPKYQVIVSCAKDVKTSLDQYKGMYLRFPDGTEGGNVYDIISSEFNQSSQSSKEIVLTISTNLLSATAGEAVEIVPKVKISVPDSSAGSTEQAVAYGVINSSGNLVDINFKNKGDGYNFASAHLMKPGPVSDVVLENSELRVVHSPAGGHGSNPVHELFMSRIETLTTFVSDITTNTPDSNTYTKVGIIKNPHFETLNLTTSMIPGEKYKITNLGVTNDQAAWNNIAGTSGVVYGVGDIIQPVTTSLIDGGQVMESPDTFDNRVVLRFSSDLSDSQAQPGYYVSQTISGETVSGTIHEIKKLDILGNGIDDRTDIYLVDTVTATSSVFTSVGGNVVQIKETEQSPTTTFASTITSGADASINTVVQQTYQPYTGEVLHFVDFAPITRTKESKEKVKLIFDF